VLGKSITHAAIPSIGTNTESMLIIDGPAMELYICTPCLAFATIGGFLSLANTNSPGGVRWAYFCYYFFQRTVLLVKKLPGPEQDYAESRSLNRRAFFAENSSDPEVISFLARAQNPGTAYENIASLSAWHKRMERYPQLSANEQNELVRQFQEGKSAALRLEKDHSVSRAVERKLRTSVRQGEYAAEVLAGSNFRLLLLIAREKAEERHGKDRAPALLPDLIAEANLALVQAAGDFDPSKGPSFPTYLAKVIRDRMLAVLAKEHAIKLPPSWVRVRRIYSVRYPKLADELGRSPSLSEMQADLMRVCMDWARSKLSPGELLLSEQEQDEACADRLRKQGMLGAITKLSDVLSVSSQISSVDGTLGEGTESTLGDMLVSDAKDPNSEMETAELQKLVAEALRRLPEREREIVLYRYGFVDGECWTYQKISKEFGVSPERIRQIEKNVIAKMGMPSEGFGSLVFFARPED